MRLGEEAVIDRSSKKLGECLKKALTDDGTVILASCSTAKQPPSGGASIAKTILDWISTSKQKVFAPNATIHDPDCYLWVIQINFRFFQVI